MKIKARIGLIGCGNMGGAILSGLVKQGIVAKRQVFVHDVDSSKTNLIRKKLGIQSVSSSHELVKIADIIILAIKPQDFLSLGPELKIQTGSKKILISILAGTPIQKIKSVAGTHWRVVRVMPNLGAQVGEAISAVTGNEASSEGASAVATTKQIFASVGKVVQVPERYFDLVTAVSGSGPAYFFLMMELLAAICEQSGLTKEVAKTLAVQTALGSAQLAIQSPHTPAELRKMVTSKKGTTEAALAFLFQKKFDQIFKDAVRQAQKRSQQLSKSNS